MHFAMCMNKLYHWSSKLINHCCCHWQFYQFHSLLFCFARLVAVQFLMPNNIEMSGTKWVFFFSQFYCCWVRLEQRTSSTVYFCSRTEQMEDKQFNSFVLMCDVIKKSFTLFLTGFIGMFIVHITKTHSSTSWKDQGRYNLRWTSNYNSWKCLERYGNHCNLNYLKICWFRSVSLLFCSLCKDHVIQLKACFFS